MLYSEKTDDLFASQLRDWELAKVNYGLLSKVKTRRLDFDGFELLVQFNPERMRSSTAKVDAKSIEARPCFLCAGNRPPEQRGVTFENDLTILVNPFPIFPRHLTIPSEAHTDQRIRHRFITMLALAESLPGYVIFYNGPECGASAPDHFHFQAGNKGFLPVETDFVKKQRVKLLKITGGVEIWQWNKWGRGMVTLRGTNKEILDSVFTSFYVKFSGYHPDKPEPMLNILAYFYPDGWIIHIIPRKIHRPAQFFLEGDGKILLSPASVDLGGVIITPREEDFHKIGSKDIMDIFDQVCLSDDEVSGLINEL